MRRHLQIIYALALCSLHLTVLAQHDIAPAGPARQDSLSVARAEADGFENPLFKSDGLLQFTLTLDYQQLLQDRGDERGYHPATLTYRDTTGAVVALNLKVMVRGNHRRDPNTCKFPPLLLNFSRKTNRNTVFEHVNKVKLVTHCIGEDYVHKEYLVYKLYNLLTDKSFRARLCRITYEDLQSKRKVETKFAFLIEDDKEMARRNRGQLVPKALAIGMEGTDSGSMATLAMFQYMIGNTDWSVPYRHNIKLLSLDSLRAPYAVPYDFDYSGIVAPPYAVPPPELGITTVRQRLYRGYDFPSHIYAEVVRTFAARRAAIYRLYTSYPYIDKGTRKKTLSFLDGFFQTLDDPKEFDRNIVRVGQRNQKSYVTVKGLKE